MPRGRDEMQVNVAGLRRNIKNLAHNYSDAQVKVREATSNDPWGPSSTLMAEIADLTYNVMAFTEIMQMIWKRLNDHGKNWRHVYKALVLLEYLLKTGSDRVALQCKENIFAIQTLKDFQYMEEGKDQGLNVREKAKQLVVLLKDEERLKAERERAMKAKQRFAQSASSFGDADEAAEPRDAELARPLTAGEEELQLQLALAMSREEAEREERRRRSDDVRLQLALSQSQQDFQQPDSSSPPAGGHLLDLLDVNLSPPAPAPRAPPPDPWQMPAQDTAADAWGAVGSPPRDPWAPAPPPDPWAPALPLQSKSPPSLVSPASSSDLEQFDALSRRRDQDPFDLSALEGPLSPSPATNGMSSGATKKSPSAFLGENSSLVNLERLLQPAPAPAAPNPFAEPPRPFLPPQPAKLSINELKQQQMGLSGLAFPSGAAPPAAAPADPWAPAPAPRGASPWSPQNHRHTPNPFLS